MKREAAVYLTTKTVNSIIPFMLLPIITRLVTPEEYAKIGLFVAMNSIISAFIGLGLQAAIKVNYIKLPKEEFRAYASNAVFIMLLSSVLTILIVLSISDHIASSLNITTDIVVLSIATTVAQQIIIVTLSLYQIERKAWKFGFLQSLLTILNLTLSIYLVVSLEMEAIGRIEGITYSTITVSIFCIYILKKMRFSPALISKKYLDEALRFGLPMLPHALIMSLIPIADRLILSHQVGLESVGVLFFATQIALPIAILGTSINLAFVPWCFREMKKNNNLKVVKTTYKIMFFLILTTVFYVAVIPYLLPYIAPAEYYEDRNIIFIIAFSFLLQGLYLLVAKSFTYAEEIKKLSYITVPLGILYVLLAYFIAGSYGIYGVVYSLLLLKFLVFVLTWFFANKIYPQPWLYIFK